MITLLQTSARESFINRFRKNQIPDDMPELTCCHAARQGSLVIAHLLRQAGLVTSTSEAFRMIKQGAVQIDGEKDRG